MERDVRNYRTGRRLLRTVLGAELGLAPERLAFIAGPAGKPGLAPEIDHGGLAFNLSHSGRLVVLAVTRGRRVGVDVQEERPGVEIEPLARRFFCEAEAAAIRAAAGPAEAERLFFRYWTLKEAYLKAEGAGLTLDLRSVDVSGCPPGYGAAPIRPGEDVPRGIRVLPFEVDAGYAAAVAADGDDWTCDVRRWP